MDSRWYVCVSSDTDCGIELLDLCVFHPRRSVRVVLMDIAVGVHPLPTVTLEYNLSRFWLGLGQPVAGKICAFLYVSEDLREPDAKADDGPV